MTESDTRALPCDNDVSGDITDESLNSKRMTSPQIRIIPCDAPSSYITPGGDTTSDATGCLGSDYCSDTDISSGFEDVPRRCLSSSAIHRESCEDHLGWSRPLGGRMRIPRDPIQPSHGSISDVHSDTSAEEDHFEVFHRPRSRTCPEEIMRRRRSRMRTRDRPPTPPPGLAFACASEKHDCLSPTRNTHNASQRSLPELPELGALPTPVIVAERWNSVEDINRWETPVEEDWAARRVDDWMDGIKAAGVETKK